MSFIDIINLTKQYNSNDVQTMALDHVSFSLDEGDFCVVLGQSGAGKTTLLNMLGGMDSPTSGSITVDGTDISSMGERALTQYRRNSIGFVFQFYNIIPNLTILENVEMVARFGGKNFNPQAVLSDVGLGEKTHAFPQELSGGQLQRVAIARALCKNPQLLLCDEPTGALDSKTGQSILKLLMRMSRQYRKTVIVVTHNSSIARIADVVVTIKDGKTESVLRNNNPESITQIQW
ncbi:macrolide ABC transporter ATP-binding protein [Bifidobacteriaceae bacterium NR016]|nr:macrolide ABC transporter ATP-binding protein [Bifidobacteriaceae bacterium NR016]